MAGAQQWAACDKRIKAFVEGFVALLRRYLGETLKGVYLHGSLAMGSFYPPNSDMDILAVAFGRLPPEEAAVLNLSIARYAQTRPLAGNLEFSLISASTALHPPSRPPYILHYSGLWHDRILRGEMTYTGHMTDIDLCAHMMVVKRRGVCLYGEPVDCTFGEVEWEDALFAVTADLEDILEGERILQIPCYGVLNICRSLHMLAEDDRCCLNKDEGGAWAIAHLPSIHHPIVRQALRVYHGETLPETGWDAAALCRLRDYARELYGQWKAKRGSFPLPETGEKASSAVKPS